MGQGQLRFGDFFGHGTDEYLSRSHLSAPSLRRFFGMRTRRDGRSSLRETLEGLPEGRRESMRMIQSLTSILSMYGEAIDAI